MSGVGVGIGRLRGPKRGTACHMPTLHIEATPQCVSDGEDYVLLDFSSAFAFLKTAPRKLFHVYWPERVTEHVRCGRVVLFSE